ncbi:hypothetical protein HJG60_011769 [Phyllostomus discolor]|uniref:Uncharacterized protein n=1 Tax=Phyllostomus discolor TaxID=89673 RepID=A0A833ZIY1_9CHIR|nr:hypothetical protein HJG60_011769 [Phyllostomus discolor]
MRHRPAAPGPWKRQRQGLAVPQSLRREHSPADTAPLARGTALGSGPLSGTRLCDSCRHSPWTLSSWGQGPQGAGHGAVPFCLLKQRRAAWGQGTTRLRVPPGSPLTPPPQHLPSGLCPRPDSNSVGQEISSGVPTAPRRLHTHLQQAGRCPREAGGRGGAGAFTWNTARRSRTCWPRPQQSGAGLGGGGRDRAGPSAGPTSPTLLGSGTRFAAVTLSAGTGGPGCSPKASRVRRQPGEAAQGRSLGPGSPRELPSPAAALRGHPPGRRDPGETEGRAPPRLQS